MTTIVPWMLRPTDRRETLEEPAHRDRCLSLFYSTHHQDSAGMAQKRGDLPP